MERETEFIEILTFLLHSSHRAFLERPLEDSALDKLGNIPEAHRLEDGEAG